MIKAIIFDFDGVILESAAIKTEAFEQMVGQYPAAIDRKNHFGKGQNRESDVRILCSLLGGNNDHSNNTNHPADLPHGRIAGNRSSAHPE